MAKVVASYVRQLLRPTASHTDARTNPVSAYDYLSGGSSSEEPHSKTHFTLVEEMNANGLSLREMDWIPCMINHYLKGIRKFELRSTILQALAFSTYILYWYRF